MGFPRCGGSKSQATKPDSNQIGSTIVKKGALQANNTYELECKGSNV